MKHIQNRIVKQAISPPFFLVGKQRSLSIHFINLIKQVCCNNCKWLSRRWVINVLLKVERYIDIRSAKHFRIMVSEFSHFTSRVVEIEGWFFKRQITQSRNLYALSCACKGILNHYLALEILCSVRSGVAFGLSCFPLPLLVSLSEASGMCKIGC